MAARYQAWLRDAAGNRLAVWSDWQTARFWKLVNDVGGFDLTMRDDPGQDLTDQFFDSEGKPHRDLLFELWRSDLTTDPSRSLALYREFGGFTRYGRRYVDHEGQHWLQVMGVEYTHLVQRASIAWYAGSSQTDKSGPAESVLKELATENLGAGALLASGRDRDHVFSGLSVAADGAGGNTWSGQRSHRDLFEIMREIALPGGVRFRIEPGASPATFVFDARPDQWGEDRSTVGLIAATGRNAAGNVPVIFALERGNMTEPEYVADYQTEATVCLVQGQGEGQDRMVVVRTSGTESDSPWNDIEVCRDARDTDGTADLESRGDEVLEEYRERESFRMGVLQVPSTIYGLDYGLGDRVTARFKGRELHVEIMGVEVAVERPGLEDQTERVVLSLEEL